MTVNDASLGESGSKLSKVAATSLLMGVTRASSEAYVPAHKRDPRTAFVSKTGVPAHERDPRTAFVNETGVPAHERDPQAAFRLLIVRMVLKIAAAA